MHYLKWWDYLFVFEFHILRPTYRIFKTKVSLQKIQHQNTLVPSNPDNTLPKISSRTSTFWSWDFHIHSQMKFVVIFGSCLLHLKQKTWLSPPRPPIPKLNCLQPLWIHGKENFGRFSVCYLLNWVEKQRKLERWGITSLKQCYNSKSSGTQGDKTTSSSRSCSRRSDGKTQKFV